VFYIATKYADQGTPLIPTEIKANALFQQATFMEVAYFNEYAEKAVHENLIHP
jgi:glutathione S-transferase